MEAEELFLHYIQKCDRPGIRLSEDAGHSIASMLLSYRMSLFGRVREKAEEILKNPEIIKAEETVKKSIQILLYETMQKKGTRRIIGSGFNFDGGDAVIPVSSFSADAPIFEPFKEQETLQLAIESKDTEIMSLESYHEDMALALLYAVAYISSPGDRQPLEEHLSGLIIQKLEIYLTHV